MSYRGHTGINTRVHNCEQRVHSKDRLEMGCDCILCSGVGWGLKSFLFIVKDLRG